MRHRVVLLPALLTSAVLPDHVRAEPEFVRGDVDMDGSVNTTDIIALLDHLFRGTRPIACPAAADSNDNDVVDVSDAVWTLTYLFRGGAPLAEPFPGCGEDPDPGPLLCLATCSPPQTCCPFPIVRHPGEVNTVRSIRERFGRIEIMFWSSRTFPPRVDVPTLCIGTLEFALSALDIVDSETVLVFFLTPDEFTNAQSGAEVSVQYACSPEEKDRWSFGPFDKSLLRK